jgi:hypothetical protein
MAYRGANLTLYPFDHTYSRSSIDNEKHTGDLTAEVLTNEACTFPNMDPQTLDDVVLLSPLTLIHEQ